MSGRPQTHRESTLRRRQALLDAAVEVVAERGVGAPTHRAVAARAGLPLATTSYFFDSLDDLLMAAMRQFTAETISRSEELAAFLGADQITPEQAADAFVDLLVAQPTWRLVAQFEAYMEASRRDDARIEINKVLDTFVTTASKALAAAGLEEPDAAALAFIALADGFSLQRIVRGEPDPATIKDAFRRLLASYR